MGSEITADGGGLDVGECPSAAAPDLAVVVDEPGGAGDSLEDS